MPEASNLVTGAIPDTPFFAASHEASKELPNGLTAPIPVTATFFIVNYNTTRWFTMNPSHKPK